MGRRSTKENKTVYQQAREDMGLTREAAEEALQFITADRIEKIESEKLVARPEEVLQMAKCYKHPELCNYYCSHECPIGIKYVPQIEMKELSTIVLEMLATVNQFENEKNRLIEITVDGQISEDEKVDFESIRDNLANMSASINALSLWVEDAINTGKISK